MSVCKLEVRFVRIFLLVSLLSSPAMAAEKDAALPTSVLQTRPAQYRLSYERLDIGASKDMGLGSLSYLVNVSPSIYAGLSAYGVMRGEQGGFFSGGLEVGTGKRYGDYLLTGGLFVGGGGRSVSQDDGLLLRPHLGVSRMFKDFSLGLGFSWVKFPDGEIDSKQLFLMMGIPMDFVYADQRYAGMTLDTREAADFGLRKGRSRLVAKVERYLPAGSVKTTKALPMVNLDTLGFEYQYDLTPSWFGFLEAAGAGKGKSDGFAEALLGVGWGLPIMGGSTRLNLKASVGGGGGGRVDTGGGLMGKGRIGVAHQFSPRLAAGLDVGRVISNGAFKGNSVALNLNYALDELNLTRHGKALEKDADVILQGWEAAASHQSYFKTRRKNGKNAGIDLVGMKLARQLGEHSYMTGQAYGGYEGGAGSYTVGLLGPGWKYGFADSPWSVSLETLLGVGGGGALDVNGGSLAQIQAGVRYRFSRNLALQLEVGQVKSLSGDLNSGIANLNLVYSFSKPEMRISATP